MAKEAPNLDNIGDDDDVKAEAVVPTAAAAGKTPSPLPNPAPEPKSETKTQDTKAAVEELLKALDAADGEEQAAPVADKFPVPATLKEALQMHSEALAMPAASPRQKAVKSAALAHTSKHLHELQQGVATPVITGASVSHQFALMTKSGDEQHLVQLAYQYPAIKKLVEERDALKAELAKLQKK